MTATLILDNATVTHYPKIRVSGKNIFAEAKVSDGNLNVKVYGAQLQHVFYMLKYFIVGSRHRITGPIGVSAYTFDNSAKAHPSVRVGIRTMRPLADQDAEGNIIRSKAPVLTETNVVLVPLFFKFIVYKYTFENWDNELLVNTNKSSKNGVATTLRSLYNQLVSRSLLPPGFSPVLEHEIVLNREVFNAGLRPTNEVMSRGSDITYRVNPSLRPVDFSLDILSYQNLMNALFVFPVEHFINHD